MWFVNVERGKREGMALSRELNKTTMANANHFESEDHQDRDLEEEQPESDEEDAR